MTARVRAGYWARCPDCDHFTVFSHEKRMAQMAADEHNATTHPEARP